MTTAVLTQPEWSLSAPVSPLKQCASEAQADGRILGTNENNSSVLAPHTAWLHGGECVRLCQ